MDLQDENALLSEALAPHVPTAGSASDPGCYALNIETPAGGHETHARVWLESGYEETPPYLQQIADASRVIYVGRSSNVRQRIQEHLDGDTRKATLPSVYEVFGICGVQWGTNTDHAERSYADHFRESSRGDTYVHTR